MSEYEYELLRKRERIFLEEVAKLLSSPGAREKIERFRRRWPIADDAVWPPLKEPVDQERRKAWAKDGLYRGRQTFLKRPPCDIDWINPRGTYMLELRQLAQDLSLLPDHAGHVEFIIWNVLSPKDFPTLTPDELYELQSERCDIPIAIPRFKRVGIATWLALPVIDFLRDRFVTTRRSPHASEQDYRAVSPIISRYMKLSPSEPKAARIKRGGTKKGRASGMRPATKEKYQRICEQYDEIATQHPHLAMKEIARMIGQPRSSIYRALGARARGELK